jgi:hypothetical protein
MDPRLPVFVEALLRQHNRQPDKTLREALAPKVQILSSALLFLYNRKSEAEYRAYLETKFPSAVINGDDATMTDECRAAECYLLLCRKEIHQILAKRAESQKENNETQIIVKT